MTVAREILGRHFIKVLGILTASLLIGVSCSRVKETESSNSTISAGDAEFNVTGPGRAVAGRGKIFTVCFYGENDHDNVARNKCNEMYQACRQRYGASRCVKVVNPTQERLAQIQGQGIVIVVTHTTPGTSSPDAVPNPDCKIDIWDSPVSPKDIDQCGLPVVWYGCYGKGVADECKNVIPLQDTPTVLDSTDPKISCRFKATMLCWEEFTRANRPMTPSEFQQCVYSKVQKLQQDGDPFCPGLGTKVMSAPIGPSPFEQQSMPSSQVSPSSDVNAPSSLSPSSVVPH